MEEKQKFKDKTFSTRRFSQFGYAAVLVLALVFAGWGAFTTISGAVIASGQVASSGGDYVIEHPKGGAMARLFAANGDRVAAGDILLCLDGRELRAEIAIGETEYFSLMARRNRLEAELAGIVSESGADRIEWDAELTEALENGDGAPRIALLGQEKLFEVRNAGRRNQLTQMQEQVNQTRQEIKGLQAHASAYRSQLRLVSQELDVVQDLYRKEAAVLTDVLKLERDKAIVEGELGNLSSKIAIARGRIAELELRMSQFSTDQVEEMEHEVREIQVRENSLREHLGSLLVEERELCLRAPQTGYIHNLSVSAESEVIEPGEPVAVIVPEKAKFIVHVQLNTIDIDQIRLGQPTVLRFSAFSASATPEYSGTVSYISKDAVFNEESEFQWYDIHVEVGEPVRPEEFGLLDRFRCLSTESLKEFMESVKGFMTDCKENKMWDQMNSPDAAMQADGSISLTLGMPVEVYIRTRDRTPISYLMKPLSDSIKRSMREE